MRLVILENGDRFRAKGIIVTAWELAQLWYTKSPHRTVPIAEWEKAQIPVTVIQVGLAVITDSGVYVAGANEQFNWLLERRDAGKKGGLKTQEKISSKAKAKSSKAKPLTLSLSLSPSLPLFSDSSSGSNSNSNTEELRVPTGSAKPDARRVPISKATWEAYRDAYLKRYQVEPVRNATVNGQLANFVKRLGEEEAPLVAAYYLNHNKAFYVEQRHPVGMLLRDAEGLRTQWLTGKQSNRHESIAAENQGHMRSQLDRIRKGEL